MMALYATLLAQAWNILGGYGGQFSLRPCAVLRHRRLRAGHGAAAAAASMPGWRWRWPSARRRRSAPFVGALAFRYGLKGSYFALVTLAFAEVFRILAVSVGFTGGGVGLMLPLQRGVRQLQFGSRQRLRRPGAAASSSLALLVTAWLRHSRFGARLQAVRDNEDAARARRRRPAAAPSSAPSRCRARFMGAGRRVLRAGVPVHRPGHRLRAGDARWRRWSAPSSAAWARCGGRCSARWCCTRWPRSRATCSAQLPGLNMVIYGAVLVLIVMFLPRGLAGIGRSVRDAVAGGRAWLSRCCDVRRPVASPSAGLRRCRT